MTATLEDCEKIEIKRWSSLNTAADASRLPLGQTPNCDNIWPDEKPGSVITALGFKKVGTVPSNLPVTLCFNYFKQSDGSQAFIVSDNNKVWTTVNFVNFTEIATGLAVSFQLRACAVRDKVWLTNGSDPVMTWNGTVLVSLDGSGGKPNVPHGRFIAYHHERVWLYHVSGDRSILWFSSLTDNTGAEVASDNASAWGISSNFLQISEGDSDFGTGLVVYRGNLYAFKQQRIYRIVGEDEFSYSRVKTKASVGTRFAESIQEIDDVIQFIAKGGIYKFNGDETERVSDIISRDIGNLLQPFLNNQFWTISSEAEFNTGASGLGLFDTTSGALLLKPADDSEDDFVAGAVKTNIDTSTQSGDIILASEVPGAQTSNVAIGAAVAVVAPTGVGLNLNLAPLTDGIGNTTRTLIAQGFQPATMTISFNQAYRFGRLIIRDLFFAPRSGNATVNVDIYGYVNSVWTLLVSKNLLTNTTAAYGPQHTIFDSTLPGIVSVTGLKIVANSTPFLSFSCTQLQFFPLGYQASGKFVSKTIDYGATPASFGTLAATTTLNSQAIQFFTQSSADGISWDAEVNVANGASIGGTVRRYLRWGAYFSSTGLTTPVISNVYVGGSYISIIKDTGGSIFAWGPFEAQASVNGGTITYYYRANATAGGVLGEAWIAISPGAVIGATTAQTNIQIRIEMSTPDAARPPSVQDHTANWIKGTGQQVQTLQNIGSIVWNNRYWMSAAKKGSTSNNTILVRGKKEYTEPWSRKSWSILSFGIFQDNLYGGSSNDGSIYRLDFGYSYDGAAMDSLFETGDVSGKPETDSDRNQLVRLLEIGLVVEKMGEYNLTVGYSFDRGVTWTDKSVSLSGTGRKKVQLNVDQQGDFFRLRVRTNGVDQPFEVHEMFAYYKLLKTRRTLGT